MISSWCLTNYLIPDRQTVHSGEGLEPEEAIWHTIGVSPLRWWRSKWPTASGSGLRRFSLAFLFSHHLPELQSYGKGDYSMGSATSTLAPPPGHSYSNHKKQLQCTPPPPRAMLFHAGCMLFPCAVIAAPRLTLLCCVQNPSSFLLSAEACYSFSSGSL